MKEVFCNEPLKGAEYFGTCVIISILFDDTEEIVERVRIAVRYARKHLDRSWKHRLVERFAAPAPSAAGTGS